MSLDGYGLKGQTAMVTGAGSGIGNVVALKLHEAGAQVIALVQNQEQLEQILAQIPGIEAKICDLCDWEATKTTLKDYRVDLLVNNAGIVILEPVGEIQESSFIKTIDINTKAVINVTQCCLAHMKANNKGAIVNVSSQAAVAALKQHAVYAASKAAVDMITKVFALELGQFNIRINSVQPTVTMTPLGRVAWADETASREMKAKIPLGRFAEPEEIADTILYLLSDRASMITGANVSVDGGFTAC